MGIGRARPGSPSNSDDLDFSKLPDAPWVVESETPQYGALQSAYEGAKAGLTANFSDELGGASAASGLPRNLPSSSGNFANLAYKAVKPTIGAARLAYEHLTGQPGPATEEYNKAVDEIRARQEAMKAQHPYAYGAGEIGGGLASIAIAPEARAASLGSRALQAGKVGAAYGALSGAGEGTNPDERAENALIGAVTGGAGAAGAVPVSALAEKVISGATKPVVGAVRGGSTRKQKRLAVSALRWSAITRTSRPVRLKGSRQRNIFQRRLKVSLSSSEISAGLPRKP